MANQFDDSAMQASKSMTVFQGKKPGEDDLKQCWEAFGLYIFRQMKMGRSVVYPNFGKFTFTAPHCNLSGVTNPDKRDKQFRNPVFLVNVVKCRRQVDPTLYSSLGDGLSKIKASKGLGPKGLFLGFGPTFVGYSFQGFGKFGFYEIFKDVYKAIVGEENAVKYKKVGWSIASGTAELIADTLLCPFEAVKVRMQVAPEGEFTTSFIKAFNEMKAAEGTAGLYKGLIPLWTRQIPYTIVKFVAFEEVSGMFYQHVFTKPKNEYGKATQLGITFASGYIAGVFCAIVSHPADTMVSKINALKTEGSFMQNAGKIYGEIGFKGLWAGLVTRIIMIGTLTGLQWWIYDTFKTAVGLQTSGGGVVKKQ